MGHSPARVARGTGPRRPYVGGVQCDDMGFLGTQECLLRAILAAATAPDWIGWAISGVGIVVSALLAWAAIALANAANRLATEGNAMAEAANRLASEAIELTERSERRRFADAVEAFYQRVREKIRDGSVRKGDHATQQAMRVAKEIGEPTALELLAWLIDAAERAGNKERPVTYRHEDVSYLDQLVPIEVGGWVRDPKKFKPQEFTLHEGMTIGLGKEN